MEIFFLPGRGGGGVEKYTEMSGCNEWRLDCAWIKTNTAKIS